ncbi:hypothetical protein N9L76_05945, partial [bacterium]|nr:hypothetical protein [bacterium]
MDPYAGDARNAQNGVFPNTPVRRGVHRRPLCKPLGAEGSARGHGGGQTDGRTETLKVCVSSAFCIFP